MSDSKDNVHAEARGRDLRALVRTGTGNVDGLREVAEDDGNEDSGLDLRAVYGLGWFRFRFVCFV